MRPAELDNIPIMIALGVLIHRLGGEVLISQADIDEIAYGKVLEGWTEDGSVALKYVPMEGTGRPT